MIAFSMFLIDTVWIGDTKYAGAFTWSWTDSSGELREVVGLVAVDR